MNSENNAPAWVPPGGEQASSLRVLLAEQAGHVDYQLANILSNAGHQVATITIDAAEFPHDLNAVTDEEGSAQPELVVLNVDESSLQLSDSDQREALTTLISNIKQNTSLGSLPILLSAPSLEPQLLDYYLNHGVDDYLTQPYTPLLLNSKLRLHAELRDMRESLQLQYSQIKENELQLSQEHTVAKAVFDNVLHSGCLDAQNIQYMLSSLAMFNGDVLLAALKPSGGMHVFLGDFTGHGLPAAVGALPLAELFYYLSSKGYTISDIIAEMNAKLKAVLPTGFFCCGCMVDVSFEKQMIKVWSGGLPDSYLYRADNGVVDIISSRHLPLGILDSGEFKVDLQVLEMSRGDRLLICSDGVSEAVNDKGEMFGDARVKQLVEDSASNNADPEKLFQRVKDSVHDFMGSTDREDDMTMVEVLMVGDFELQNMQASLSGARSGGPKDWSMTYELGPETLKNFNPLPLMLHIVMEVPGLRPYNGQVYTILAELFSNALEHGVLALSSQLKATAAGFMEYYELRAEKLMDLNEGFVRATLTHTPTEHGGALQIAIEDSGEGFDVIDVLRHPGRGTSYCGRGIPMVNGLCDSLEFNQQGNKVEACYIWHFD